MKMTPKGERFADVIKQELAAPDSDISRSVRKLNAWKRVIAGNPKRYRFELDLFGGISVVDNKAPQYSSPEQISYFNDVSLWWPKNNPLEN